jgi:hypothetical protein
MTGKGILAFLVWAYMLTYFFAHLAFYAVTIRYSQRLGPMKSVLVALVAFFRSFAVWIMIVR